MTMRIAGLDFETANPADGSICAVGCALLEDGAAVERNEWLVRPYRTLDRVHGICYAVHGISWYDLRDAPEFPAVWPVLRRMLGQADAVAIHNAPFDLRHLRAVLTLYGLPPVGFDYFCTLAASRELLPQLERHSLDAVAKHFGIEFRHHDALEDAEACATVAFRLGVPEKFRDRFDYSPPAI